MPGSKIVRVINASIEETIEIRWWRFLQQTMVGEMDKYKPEILIERHNAPPTETWNARLAEQTEQTEQPTEDPIV